MIAKRLLLVLILASQLFGHAKDSVLTARQAFDKVEFYPGIPRAADVAACIDAQADAVKPAGADRHTVKERRAYCQFLSAALAQDPAALTKAAAALEHERGEGKSDSAPLLAIAADLAKLKAQGSASLDTHAVEDLGIALLSVNCLNAGFARTSTCNALEGAARLWIGWSALRNGELVQAETAFHHVDGAPWNAWLTGTYALEAAHWREAALAFADAATGWRIRGDSLTEWLGPRLPEGELNAQLAWAQVMAGDTEPAALNLDAAIAARPRDARSLFLRARLRESPADLEAAVKAAAPDQAHYYQGVLFERRREYPAATREFDAALSAAPSGMERTDIAAWKSLTDAAAGECPPDPSVAEKVAAAASPLFPKQEYASLIFACRAGAVPTLDQLLQLDRAARPLLPSGFERVRTAMAAAYIRLGLQAEDHKDAAHAELAYTRALEWWPRNTRARFNLAAIYLGDQKFGQAEAEYRALLAADPADREAQFWLGQSILASATDAARKAEGCALLQQSIQIQDSAKRDQFASAVSTSGCAR